MTPHTFTYASICTCRACAVAAVSPLSRGSPLCGALPAVRSGSGGITSPYRACDCQCFRDGRAPRVREYTSPGHGQHCCHLASIRRTTALRSCGVRACVEKAATEPLVEISSGAPQLRPVPATQPRDGVRAPFSSVCCAARDDPSPRSAADDVASRPPPTSLTRDARAPDGCGRRSAAGLRGCRGDRSAS